MSSDSGPPPVSLQISLVPPDIDHAIHTLPHQLRQWDRQVREVLFVVDRTPDEVGSARDRALHRYLVELCQTYPNAQIRDVDYSARARAQIAERFLGGRPMPARDYRSTPIYASLFGLDVARHDLVLHMDSDMLFGGGSSAWVAEGIRLLAERPDAVAVSPLPGPPITGGRLPDDVARRHLLAHGTDLATPDLQPTRERHSSLAYRFSGISWRVFMMDRERLHERLTLIRLRRARPRQFLIALADRTEPWATLENSTSRAMLEHGLYRIDFLGSEPGVWSLHPPLRSAEFYRDLPTLIRRVELGDIPEGQLGDYELNDSLVDWTAARDAQRRRRWWRRFRTRRGQSALTTSSRSGSRASP